MRSAASAHTVAVNARTAFYAAPGSSAQRGAPGHIGVFTFPAYGHIAPELPVLAELVRRGHRVTCFVAERFVELAASAGVETVVYESRFPWYDGQTGSMLQTMLDFFEESFAPLAAAYSRLSDDRPDLIAHDVAVSESGRLLARAWGLPVVQLCPTLASNPGFSMGQQQNEAADTPPEPIDPGHPSILEFIARRDHLLAACGLDGVSTEGFGAEHGDNLVLVPKEFQIEAASFDDRFSFIGPCLTEAPDTGSGWSPPDDGRRVLLLSLGSSYSPGMGEFLRSCVEALADSPWHVVMTLGHRVHPDELGPLPANVEAHQWLKHPQVLRHAAAFITHAGIGSVMESLYYGVPMVLVPHHVDQRVTAARAAELNLGRALSRDAESVKALLATIGQVADDPGIRDAVAHMRQLVREGGGAARGADVVESLMLAPAQTAASRPVPTAATNARTAQTAPTTEVTQP